MKRLSKWLFVVAVSAGITLPSASFATNGMFLIGFGSKSRSMGGTAIANPQDTLAGAANPAAISYFGTRIDVAADLFLPRARACTTIVDGTEHCETSRADTFLIPAMGGAMKFNRKLSFGFSAVGVGGGGSRYNRNLFNLAASRDPTETLGINLMVMQMNPTIAYRVEKNHTIGVSPVFSVQTFRAFGLSEFSTFTGDGRPLRAQGNDWSYGAGLRIGYMGRFMKKRLLVGFSGSTRIYMTDFDKYDNLFPEQGNLDTPPVFGLGLSYKVTDKLTFAFDVTHTLYEDVASISNQGPCIPADPTCNSAANPGGGEPFPVSRAVNALGLDDGLGFGWENQTVYKVGIAYDYNNHWSFRAGWNYGESPIDEAEDVYFNTLAPAVVEHHLTLGTSYRPSKKAEWSMHYVHAFKNELNGPTYLGNPGEISMYQNSLGGSFSYYF